MVKFLKAEVSYPSKYDDLVQTSTFMDDTIKCLHSSMTAQNIHRMNANALRYLSAVLNALPKEGDVEIPNLWLWVREELTVATCEALYGSHNPFKSGSTLVGDLWFVPSPYPSPDSIRLQLIPSACRTFEAKLSNFLLGLAPSITAPAAYKARSRLQAALKEYYSNSHDTDEHAANLVSECAQIIRQHGIAAEDAGYFGIPILHVSTANSIPVAYWFFSEVFSKPDLVQELREECEGAITWGTKKKEATVNLDVLAEKCPLLFSCYRETIRTNNQTPISRRVTSTTTITDNKGTIYTLQADTDLQCSMGALHRNTTIWGSDANIFNPYRFLKMDAEPATANKTRRAAFVPFGGGQHLCPGRTFAQAENLGFVLALVLGFDVFPIQRGKGWEEVVLPGKMELNLGQALHKPVNEGEGFGVRIGRRGGWEGVQWQFVSGSN